MWRPVQPGANNAKVVVRDRLVAAQVLLAAVSVTLKSQANVSYIVTAIILGGYNWLTSIPWSLMITS
jgi:hypothetical protein